MSGKNRLGVLIGLFIIYIFLTWIFFSIYPVESLNATHILALIVLLSAEIAFDVAVSSQLGPPIPMLILPFVMTVGYALWCRHNLLAFLGGFFYSWDFPVALILQQQIRLKTNDSLPIDVIIFFLVLSTSGSILGLRARVG